MVATPKRSLTIGVVPDLPTSPTMRNIISHYQTLASLDVGLTLDLSLWLEPVLLMTLSAELVAEVISFKTARIIK